MIRIVIDTSVLIRYLIRPGAAVTELLEEYWARGHVQVVTAPELVRELEIVLARDKIRQGLRAGADTLLFDAIAKGADILPPLGAVPSYTRDPKDDKFVACAIAGQADFLVTFDEDLLVLRQVGETRIVTPYQLLAELTSP